VPRLALGRAGVDELPLDVGIDLARGREIGVAVEPAGKARNGWRSTCSELIRRKSPCAAK
jgi:hypothetical protein